MLDSSWNSAAYQRCTAEIAVLRNGDDDGLYILYDTSSGKPLSAATYATREEAEQARRKIYDA